MDLESDEDGKEEGEDGQQEQYEKERSHIMEELWLEGVKLPPEPAGHCARELQDKMEGAWRKMVEQGSTTTGSSRTRRPSGIPAYTTNSSFTATLMN